MKVAKELIMDKQILRDIIQNREYNTTVIGYYERFSYEYLIRKDILHNRSQAIEDCNKFWLLDKYEDQEIKDVKRQNLCKDKFCSNCKKVKQSARMARYIPELEQYDNKLYHLTLTLPNPNGKELKDTVKLMAKSFRTLIRLIRGTIKSKDVDFSNWNYQGAVRSLEITFKNDDYHPHYHVGFVLNENLMSNKTNINSFSYDNKNGIRELKRLFSDEEILIQKVWYLLINGEKITRSNIDELEEGYTCVMDKFSEGDFAELFKYMTKEKDQNGSLLSYDNFKVLYEALYRVKQIQGYGCLFRIKDDIDLEEYEIKWNNYIEEIRKKENPVEVLETPQDLCLDSRYTLISRKSYYKYLRTL